MIDMDNSPRASIRDNCQNRVREGRSVPKARDKCVLRASERTYVRATGGELATASQLLRMLGHSVATVRGITVGPDEIG